MKERFKKTKLNTLKALASVLSFAGIATAAVSLVTTAEGISTFLPEPWQAFLISTAIQFPLFAINIKYAELWHTIKSWKRIILPFFISLLLCVSSTFSFVYMAGTAYPQSVFVEDAERILDTTVFETNLDLNEALKNVIDDYTASDGIISEYLSSAENYSSDTAGFSDLSNVIESLEGHSDLTGILESLKVLTPNTYNEETIAHLTETIDSTHKLLTESINDSKEQIGNLYIAIQADSERLKTINDINSEVYISIVNRMNNNYQTIADLNKKIDEYQAEINILESVSLSIRMLTDGNEMRLTGTVNAIRELLLASEIRKTDLLKKAEEIHACLLDCKVSSDNFLLTEYSSFLEQITSFSTVKSAQLQVEKEIEELQNRSLTTTIYGVGNLNDKNAIFGWRSYWNERIVALREVLKSIPAEFLVDTNYSIESRGAMLSKLDSMQRLYLSDLSHFEKTWTILVGKHRYKMMVFFCLILALTLDLTSLGAGAIIFLYKDGLREEYHSEKIKRFPRAV